MEELKLKFFVKIDVRNRRFKRDRKKQCKKIMIHETQTWDFVSLESSLAMKKQDAIHKTKKVIEPRWPKVEKHDRRNPSVRFRIFCSSHLPSSDNLVTDNVFGCPSAFLLKHLESFQIWCTEWRFQWADCQTHWRRSSFLAAISRFSRGTTIRSRSK